MTETISIPAVVRTGPLAACERQRVGDFEASERPRVRPQHALIASAHEKILASAESMQRVREELDLLAATVSPLS